MIDSQVSFCCWLNKVPMNKGLSSAKCIGQERGGGLYYWCLTRPDHSAPLTDVSRCSRGDSKVLQTWAYAVSWVLVDTTLINNAFRTPWLASLEVNNKHFSPPSWRWDKIGHKEYNFWPFFFVKERNKLIFWYLCDIKHYNYTPQCWWIIGKYKVHHIQLQQT